MENIIVSQKTKTFSDYVRSQVAEKLLTPEISRSRQVLENIRSEAGEDFFNYIHWLKLPKESNILALSSTNHFYYDLNDLKGIDTLVNLKKLNNIKHLQSYLNTVVRILPQKANFIGCFKRDKGNRSVFSFYNSSKFFNWAVNYIDSTTDTSLTKNEVSGLLEAQKLKVVDITDINGMTYFWSRNLRKSGDRLSN